MSERVEAAAKAIDQIEIHTRGFRDVALAALAAADAVMFSDEAVERAARAEHAEDWGPGAWDAQDPTVRENYVNGVRVIIAALKGAA